MLLPVLALYTTLACVMPQISSNAPDQLMIKEKSSTLQEQPGH